MNNFNARIRFCYQSGADVAYCQSDAEFKKLGLNPDSHDKDLTFLSIGNLVNLGGEEFKVTDIHISFQDYFGDNFDPSADVNLNVICRVENA